MTAPNRTTSDITRSALRARVLAAKYLTRALESAAISEPADRDHLARGEGQAELLRERIRELRAAHEAAPEADHATESEDMKAQQQQQQHPSRSRQGLHAPIRREIRDLTRSLDAADRGHARRWYLAKAEAQAKALTKQIHQAARRPRGEVA